MVPSNVEQTSAQAELANVFKSFHRSVAARSSASGGWGIGLTLVRGVAEAPGGSVSVASSEENGTVFTVHIPRDARLLALTREQNAPNETGVSRPRFV